MSTSWPPDLDALKRDMAISSDKTQHDEVLAVQLDAAVAWVEGPQCRAGSFNFSGDPTSTLPAPTADIVLGTLRLARRWNTRRNSPDGSINQGELGATTVPSLDADIERLLGIGRYREPMVG